MFRNRRFQMSGKIFQINQKDKVFLKMIKQVNGTFNQNLAKTIQKKNDRLVSLINMDSKKIHRIVIDSIMNF